MEFKLQSYNCSRCNQNDTKPLLQKHGFNIVQCRNCEFVYVNPRVENEQLADIYKHNYFQNKDYGYVSYEQEKRLRVKNFQRWLKDAERFLPPVVDVKALDVGCAAGYCLEVMRAKGWSAGGLELDGELCIALQRSGYDVSQTRLEHFETNNRYDIITLFDVIEHIPAIDAAFAHLNNLLTPDGIVVMVTPDHNSTQRKLFAKGWFQYKPIEHIQYFTKEALTAFAERNGLKMIYHSGCGQYADTQFIVNRLNYYHFSFLSKLFNTIFGVFRLKNRFFYTDTGSSYAVFKKQ